MDNNELIQFEDNKAIEKLDHNLNNFLGMKEIYSDNPIILAEIKGNIISEINLYFTDEKITTISNEFQNKSYGFRTDNPRGYDNNTVKESVIFGLLKGVHYTDNELNIIAGRGYITKEGFQGLMRRNPDFNDFSLIMKTDEIDKVKKIATIHAKANWVYRGKNYCTPEKFQVSVKWNDKMSNDAIIGKAERKVRRYACETSFNDTFSDGEPEQVERTVIEIDHKELLTNNQEV